MPLLFYKILNSYMKRKCVQLLLLAFFIVPGFLQAQTDKNKQGEYYQVTVYHFVTPDQGQLIENFLKDAYVPALHRQKIKSVGVFTPIANDTAMDKRFYVILPLSSLEAVEAIENKLDKDAAYLAGGKTFIDALYDNPAFARKEAKPSAGVRLISCPMSKATCKNSTTGRMNS